MEHLSGLDASFLYLETPNAPMQIGGLSILDPTLPDGTFGLDELHDLLASRIHVSRTFTQRLAEVPLGLGKPKWVDDEAFDIRRHIERTRLPEPGGWRELAALVAWEFSRPLPRDRPLWGIVLVEGLETVDGFPKGSVGLISKIHHAAVDGVSGSEIMSALFDVQPRSPEPPVESSGRKGSRARSSGGIELLGQAGRGIKSLTRLPGTLGRTAKGLARSGAVWGVQRVAPPPLPFTAPRTSWNTAVSKDRVWGAALLSFDRIKRLRQAADATVNDVVLAVCAGGLRRYLEERDELPSKPLVAMVPVSVRSEDEEGSMGNKVSAMLVSLETTEAEPLARLRRIRRATHRSKVHHQAVGARTLSDYSELIPFAAANFGARLYTRMQLADKHRPLFNLVITNVPGPRVPLYAGQAKLLAHVGAAPVFDGMGLILPVFSYAGTLSIGICACREALSDAAMLAEHFERALDELEEIADEMEQD